MYSEIISIYYQNIIGLRSKIEEFLKSTTYGHFGCICVLETPKLYSSANNLFCLDRYPVIRAKINDGVF